MQLNIELLRTFISLANSKSFTKTAAQINRSQSAVSMQIKRLEEEIGKDLFVRDGKTARLTSHGKFLMSFARNLVRSHDEAVASLTNVQLEGTIKFGAPEHYTIDILPKLLVNFYKFYPDVLVKIICRTSDIVRGKVESGELDLGLCIPSEKEIGKSILQEKVVWAASPEFDPINMPYIPLAVEEGCIFQDWAINALTDAGIPYRIVYVSQGLSGVLDAARSGLAITTAIERTVSPDLVILGEEAGLPTLPSSSIALCTRKGQLPEHIKCFIEHLISAYDAKK